MLLTRTCLKYKDFERLKVKEWQNKIPCNLERAISNNKHYSVTDYKIVFKGRSISGNKEGYFIIIRESNH